MPDRFGEPSTVSPSRRLSVATAVTVFSFLYLLLCMDRRVGPYDEGLMLFDTIRVMDGDVLHRDFYVNYGPAQFYILAALFKLFGASVLAERIYHAVACCGCVVFVFVIVDRLASRLAALTAAGVTLVWMDLFAMPWSGMSVVTMAVLACVMIVMPALAGGRAPLRLFATGVCAGFVLLCRYDIGVANFGAFGATLLIQGWTSAGDFGGRMRTATAILVPFALGLVIVVAPVAIVFVQAGVIPDFLFDIVLFPRQYYSRTRSLPFPDLAALRTAAWQLVDYLPPLVAVIAVPAVIVAFRRKPGQPLGLLASTLLLLLFLTAIGYAKAWVRISPQQALLALVTVTVIGGVLTRFVKVRLGTLLVPACLVLATLLIVIGLRKPFSAKANIVWASTASAWSLPADGVPPPSGSCRTGAGFARMACFEQPQEMTDTIRFIEAHTGVDDRIYVGLAHHDKVFVDNILLYFAADRRSVTKWHHFDPMLQNSVPIQEAMIAELRRAQPKLIVLDATWNDVNEPNDSRLSTGVTLLDDYISEAYEPVKQFGMLTILQPRRKPSS